MGREAEAMGREVGLRGRESEVGDPLSTPTIKATAS